MCIQLNILKHDFLTYMFIFQRSGIYFYLETRYRTFLVGAFGWVLDILRSDED